MQRVYITSNVEHAFAKASKLDPYMYAGDLLHVLHTSRSHPFEGRFEHTFKVRQNDRSSFILPLFHASWSALTSRFLVVFHIYEVQVVSGAEHKPTGWAASRSQMILPSKSAPSNFEIALAASAALVKTTTPVPADRPTAQTTHQCEFTTARLAAALIAKRQNDRACSSCADGRLSHRLGSR